VCVVGELRSYRRFRRAGSGIKYDVIIIVIGYNVGAHLSFFVCEGMW
jgi:hypothetical protein